MPRLVKSAVLYDGSRLRAGRLGRGVRREATGVAKVRAEILDEIDVLLGDCIETRGLRIYNSTGSDNTVPGDSSHLH